MSANDCPELRELVRFLEGGLAEDRIAAVENHLHDCARCLEALAALQPTDALLEQVRAWPVACASAQGEPLAVRLRAIVDTPAVTLIADPPETPDVPGYDVLEQVGQGGMGVIYKATHLALRRVVALKLLRAGADAGPGELARFRAEAEALFRDLAAAVAAAHAAEVVHRDLKPANVLLSYTSNTTYTTYENCQPKITDFGLAKRVGQEGHTLSGMVVGTPAYMAPEQARGEEVGPSADVYALGAVLYEMLTGRPPFSAATAVQTLNQVVHQDALPP